jgi:hypothetical protein
LTAFLSKTVSVDHVMSTSNPTAFASAMNLSVSFSSIPQPVRLSVSFFSADPQDNKNVRVIITKGLIIFFIKFYLVKYVILKIKLNEIKILKIKKKNLMIRFLDFPGFLKLFLYLLNY